jgi:hypothetical protein
MENTGINGVLTLDQCTTINKSLFKNNVQKSYTLKEFLERTEGNFKKGEITAEERRKSIEAFDRVRNVGSVRRADKRDEQK